MSDDEIEVKFKSMASKYMTKTKMERVIRMIYQLESLQDMGDLMKELIFDQQS